MRMSVLQPASPVGAERDSDGWKSAAVAALTAVSAR
jgi:hypothetical protein